MTTTATGRTQMSRTINLNAYAVAKTVREVAISCGYSWAEWSKATTAERGYAVTCAENGQAFIPAKIFATETEQRAAFLASLRAC